MMFTKIWEKYFLREMTTIFFLFIIGFFALYILVDFSSRHAAYQNIRFSFTDVASYYLYIMIQRWEILVPFALLIATIKTLCSLNVHNELVALLGSGTSIKTLMRPFLFFTIVITILLYLNTEFLIPTSAKELRKLEQMRFKEKYKTEQKDNIQSMNLEDESVFLYHGYDTRDHFFFDAIWIRSANDLYRMKYFYPNGKHPYAKWVDHYTRNENGQLLLTKSFSEKKMNGLKISKKDLHEVLIPPSDLSLLQLWQRWPSHKDSLTDKEAKIATAFHRKLAMPLLSLLAFLAIAPFCLQFTRQLPVFFLYLCSMFGIVAFYFIINASIILGENQVIPPFWAIWSPFIIVALIVSWRYAKL